MVVAGIKFTKRSLTSAFVGVASMYVFDRFVPPINNIATSTFDHFSLVLGGAYLGTIANNLLQRITPPK